MFQWAAMDLLKFPVRQVSSDGDAGVLPDGSDGQQRPAAESAGEHRAAERAATSASGPVLSDSATPSNLNASNFSTVKDNIC